MGSEKGRDKRKSQEGKIQKNREEIADLQKKIKTMIERRNGDKGSRGNSGPARDGE